MVRSLLLTSGEKLHLITAAYDCSCSEIVVAFPFGFSEVPVLVVVSWALWSDHLVLLLRIIVVHQYLISHEFRYVCLFCFLLKLLILLKLII